MAQKKGEESDKCVAAIIKKYLCGSASNKQDHLVIIFTFVENTLTFQENITSLLSIKTIVLSAFFQIVGNYIRTVARDEALRRTN